MRELKADIPVSTQIADWNMADAWNAYSARKSAADAAYDLYLKSCEAAGKEPDPK